MKFKFKVIEKSDDPLEAVIRKTGDYVDFTLADIRTSLGNGKRKIAEFEKQWKLAEATKQNIKNNHPHIAEMSLEDLTAAQMYRDAIGVATESSEALALYQEAMKSQEEQLEQILKQTGLEIPSVVKNEHGEQTDN